jgi:hypothetical protein
MYQLSGTGELMEHQEEPISQEITVRKMRNIPEITVRRIGDVEGPTADVEYKDEEKEEDEQDLVSDLLNMEAEEPKKRKTKKKIKKDEFGKKLLTPRQQFILQINGWLGQMQQALWMSTRVDESKQAIYTERINRFRRLVHLKLEEAELIGFKLEFYEGTGRYRGADKDYEMPDIEESVAIPEHLVQERIALLFSEKLARTSQALAIGRQTISTLAIQGRAQSVEFYQHLASTNKLEFEEKYLKELQREITEAIHMVFVAE